VRVRRFAGASAIFRLAVLIPAILALIGTVPAVSQTKPVPVPRAAPRAGAALPGTMPATGAAAGVAPQGPDSSLETLDGEGDAGFDNPDPNAPDPAADAATPSAPVDLNPTATGPVPPASPPPDPNGPPASFELVARLTDSAPPITAGLTWRVFGAEPGPDGKLKLVAESHGGSVKLTLTPGAYFIHAAYGRAGATKKITVGTGVPGDTVVLNAGGMRLSALVGKDQNIPPGDISFDVYAPDEDGSDERVLLIANAPPGKVIGLNAGTYHVVCRYGDANAVVRADIRVEPGKLTDATIYQKAARMTLKLVTEHGGEALADTSWSVVTPSGESVADSVGAFPSIVLAIGDYTAIAKHDGKIFQRNFTVEAGLNRDVEVLAR